MKQTLMQYFVLFYSCDYNKYTLAVLKRMASFHKSVLKEEIKTENELMEVDKNDDDSENDNDDNENDNDNDVISV